MHFRLTGTFSFAPLPLWLIMAISLGASTLIQAQSEYRYSLRSTEQQPEWVVSMYAPDADPGMVIPLYEAYYRTHPFVKNQHTQYYKRWISGLGKNVYADPYWDSIYLQRHHALKANRMVANWSPVGPIDWDHGAAATSYAPGSAHVYTVEQSISQPDILYAGTANAGVWKTTNRGLLWSPLTNDLLTGSVTALEIHPDNPNVVYAELLSSVRKTTNGGSTWQVTGNAAFQALSLDVHDIRCKPGEPNTVFAATSGGLFRSTDGAVNWTNVLTGDVQEIEFHPVNEDTLYAVRRNADKTEFFRSLNNGTTFTLQSNGWPNPNVGAGEHQRRTELAVTPDAPDKVFALATGSANGGSGLYGVYISTDRGVNWTFECCGPQPAGPPSLTNPNLMGWNDDGTDDGGQYYYDLAFGVSPYNEDSIWVCGVNLWVSGDGGQSFVCPAKWSHSYKPNYVHADIHDLQYMEHTGELWVAGDGGIFYSDDNGANFPRRNVGILGTDFWGFGMGHWYGDVMIGGAYHNGTLLREENVYINGWLCTDGGDGVGGYVNPGFDRQAYSNYNIKTLSGNRTIAPATRDFQYQPNSSYITGESSKLLFHPHYYGTWYTGSGTKLYITRDNGYTFEELYNFGADVAAMDLCISNPDVIYACTFPDWWGIKRIYRSLNGGATWTEITPSPATLNNTPQWVPYDIAVDPHDPMKVWIARTSMYGNSPAMNGYTVFRSDNGGTTWINISGTGLNGQYPTCLLMQKGTDGGIYIGTRQGVFYRNANMPDWQLYNAGLPARIHPVKMLPWHRMGKLRMGSDRSVWESDFYEPSDPIAIPAVQKPYLLCSRDTAYFSDVSVLQESGVSWLWNFPGGSPSTSTLRNPKVVYKKPGIYDVTLIVSDIHGTDTAVVPHMIIADNRCEVDTTPGGTMQIVSHPGHAKVNDLNLNTQTLTITAWIKPNGIQSNYSAIWMNDETAAGINFRESNNTLGYHWPGGSWSWDSNLIVPDGAWSYVAMVVQPGSVRLYVNGVWSQHNTSVQSVTLDDIRIGSYQGWSGRTFLGHIDEVCVWNRALSEDEIRLMRHLVKDPATDTSIIGYYQFDLLQSAVAVDKARGLDASLTGNVVLEASPIPVGSGTAQILNITSSGNAQFQNGGDLNVGFGTTHPNGKVVATHLRCRPDVMPPVFQPLGGYWIINNYGTQQQIPSLDSLLLQTRGALSHAMADDLSYRLYFRQQNGTGAFWKPVSTASMVPTAGLDATLKAYTLGGFGELGQWLLMRDTVATGTPDVWIGESLPAGPVVSGGESMSLHLHSDHQGLALPVFSTSALFAMGAPVAGQMAFVSDSAWMVYYNGTSWQKMELAPVLRDEADSSPLPISAVRIGNGAPDTSALLSVHGGFLKLPAFTISDLLEVEDLAPGMMVYDQTSHQIRCYDGNAWQPLSSSPTGFAVSTAAPASVPGIAINHVEKTPSSAVDLYPQNARTLQIPLVDPENIYKPGQGLLCFDPGIRRLMIFDGHRWNILP